jgi:hypothetical protein
MDMICDQLAALSDSSILFILYTYNVLAYGMLWVHLSEQ